MSWSEGLETRNDIMQKVDTRSESTMSSGSILFHFLEQASHVIHVGRPLIKYPRFGANAECAMLTVAFGVSPSVTPWREMCLRIGLHGEMPIAFSLKFSRPLNELL